VVTKGWPVRLSLGTLQLCPLSRRDQKSWISVRLDNEEWLQPWEASLLARNVVSWADRHTPAAYRYLLGRQRAGAKAGTQLPFGIFIDDRLVGQINVGEIVRGAMCSGFLGYWIDQRWAGRGVIPVSAALVADHAFREGGLHRIEANVRPENTASLAVMRKVGFTSEGIRRKYLAIDGRWCDHFSWALLVDDYPGGVLAAMLQRHPEVTAALIPARTEAARKG
jgi:ribosomal-protein-alanine N-acetyltransferase